MRKSPKLAGWTGLEPAASRVTGGRYNQLNYHPLPDDTKCIYTEKKSSMQSFFETKYDHKRESKSKSQFADTHSVHPNEYYWC
jgi:hypothetical protein